MSIQWAIDRLRPGTVRAPFTYRVVASVVLNDQDPHRVIFTVLLLDEMPPYYVVAEVIVERDIDGGIDTFVEHRSKHDNIVPAVREYEDRGGDY